MTWIIIIVLIIVVAVLTLPFFVKAMLNRTLRKMDGYTGRVDQLRINLFQSKISGHNISIDNELRGGKPLAQVPAIIIYFKWRRLLSGILDLNIVVDRPKLFLVAEKTLSEAEEATRSHELPNLKKALEKLMPFIIRVEVRDGRVRYLNPHSHPSFEIEATRLNLSICDLSNRLALSKSSGIVSTCSLYEGTAEIKATLLPLEPTLTLDLNLELKSVNLVLLNDLFRAFGKVDINRGALDLYSEVAVADNSFKGYMKPLLKDVNFISTADRSDSIVQKIWEHIVATFYNVLENSRNDQVATKIPFEGRLDDPHVRVGVAIIGILRNAFVKAMTPSLENVISLKSIWNMARSKTRKKFNEEGTPRS